MRVKALRVMAAPSERRRYYTPVWYTMNDTTGELICSEGFCRGNRFRWGAVNISRMWLRISGAILVGVGYFAMAFAMGGPGFLAAKREAFNWLLQVLILGGFGLVGICLFIGFQNELRKAIGLPPKPGRNGSRPSGPWQSLPPNPDTRD